MPRSTFRYRYEMKLIGGLGALGERLFGDTSPGGFALLLDAQGSVCSVHPASAGRAFRDVEPAAGGGMVLFDAFDAPEYIAITWNGVDRVVFERLLGLTFTDDDWQSLRADDAPCAGFPTTHFVMM
jgi:hypothetical protein